LRRDKPLSLGVNSPPFADRPAAATLSDAALKVPRTRRYRRDINPAGNAGALSEKHLYEYPDIEVSARNIEACFNSCRKTRLPLRAESGVRVLYICRKNRPNSEFCCF